MATPPSRDNAHTGYPDIGPIIDRLRDVLGPESHASPEMLRWWVEGTTKGLGVAVTMATIPPADNEPCVIWVTRPGESKPERCPIVTMSHLDAFLALVSIARRTTVPVHGHVCPGED